MKRLAVKVIGIIHSPFRQAKGTPIQSALAQGVEGWVKVFPQFVPGLQDLKGFERIWLLYWLDRATAARLVVKPFLDGQERGVFATRAPCRPNPIGLSCVRLLEVVGNVLHVDGLDILDGTPLLDIKPYIPTFDAFEPKRIGWYGDAKRGSIVADDRFSAGEA